MHMLTKLSIVHNMLKKICTYCRILLKMHKELTFPSNVHKMRLKLAIAHKMLTILPNVAQNGQMLLNMRKYSSDDVMPINYLQNAHKLPCSETQIIKCL